ncbi:DUF6228 family protein [Streptomyces sp. NPDC096324]|uniref:DUF6228 family protein n=1 Tax=Streptomyces sp. NPDC096324 TaxID=3366085 RepID=UPI0037FB2F8C
MGRGDGGKRVPLPKTSEAGKECAPGTPCYALTLSAEHHPGGHIQPTWGIRDRAPSEERQFETNTVHAAGEVMRNLTAEIRTFIAGVAE